MPSSEHAPDRPLVDHRGDRQHRFMESVDINAAFREVFQPLRAKIRQGLQIEAELYAIEADPCTPGELVDAVWLSLARYGVDHPRELSDAACRRALFQRLLAERRPESLFAYAGEHTTPSGRDLLLVEIVSADGYYAAEHRVRPGDGWYTRELVKATHRRLKPLGTPALQPNQIKPR